MIRIAKNIVSIIITVTLLYNCKSEKKPQKFDYGKVTGNMYTNSFFDFEVKIPEGWAVQSQEQTQKLAEKGAELAAGDDEYLKSAVKSAEVDSANLLVVYEYELGTEVTYNPNFMLLAENLKNTPEVKNPGEYLLHAKKLLQRSAIEYHFEEDEFEKEIISGETFYTMRCSIKYLGTEIKQKYYCVFKKGFCLSIIVSYLDAYQKRKLEAIVTESKFK
ncbi:hypothetical protein [Tenacibaculum sp. 190524A02b]|uniref:PsbP C-terminal domain-containing protein n=1 Tax=Tenacibaculum vairaonense TaxID=3137860 RepID=A0ABM9PGJ8_9FLAO